MPRRAVVPQSKKVVPTTPLELSNRWEILLNRQINHFPYSNYFEKKKSNKQTYERFKSQKRQRTNGDEGTISSPTTSNENKSDPFDCSDIIIPSTHALIDDFLVDKIEQWKNLDSRKIVQNKKENEEESNDELKKQSETKSNEPENNEKDNDSLLRHIPKLPIYRRYGFLDEEHVNHLRLPQNFDYSSRRGLPDINKDKNNRKKVVSLVNPMEQLDYETELWKIFDSVPTLDYFENIINPDTTNNENNSNNETNSTTQFQIEAIGKDIDQALREYTRVDAHALSRLRMRDRYHLPTNDTTPSLSAEKYNKSQEKLQCVTVIRIECHKRHLRRGSGICSNRLEMEFLGTHTLLDLHNAIVQQSSDPFSSEFNSGVFLIENSFYITGDENYALPIIQWLNDKKKIDIVHNNLNQSSRKRKSKLSSTSSKKSTIKVNNDSLFSLARRDFLGIQANEYYTIQKMKSIQLQDLPIRLGVRYFHGFHGDMESSIFFTDVRSIPYQNSDKKRLFFTHTFPSILDSWSSPIPCSSQVCDACIHSAAVVVCFDDELACGGDVGGRERHVSVSTSTKLCLECYYKLHYDGEGKLKYNNFKCIPMEMYEEDMSMARAPIDINF